MKTPGALGSWSSTLTRFSMTDLRRQTRMVLAAVEQEGGVVITRRGADTVAILRIDIMEWLETQSAKLDQLRRIARSAGDAE